MTIQGMGRGLRTIDVRSYYIQENALPVVSPCGNSMITATSGIGIYQSQINLGSGNGAAVIVFETGDVREGDATPGNSAINRSLGDKLVWELNGTRGSEYSAVHMGDGQSGGSSMQTMKGGGYMKGLIGSSTSAGTEVATGSWQHVSPASALSTGLGSKLTSSSTPANDDTFGAVDGSDGVYGKYAIDRADKEYEYLHATQAASAGVTHGIFKDLNKYSWDGSTYQQVGTSNGYFTGPYTGHSVGEHADVEGHSYTGSSAVSLDGTAFATRQAMMVVPVSAGGGNFLNIRIEAPMHGTWHRHMCFCPRELPKWGNADNKTGVKSDGSPYDNSLDALRHNFSDPPNPTAGSVAGANTTYYHVNSQATQYRQQGYSPFTPSTGGHVFIVSPGFTATEAGSVEWRGVVNQYDWVFTDSSGVTRVPVGFYAVLIGSVLCSVEVGDTNAAGVAQAGVVKAMVTV